MTRERLRKWRNQRKWSQTKAAEWAGTSFESWKSYENGRRPVPRWLPKMLTMQKQIDKLSKRG